MSKKNYISISELAKILGISRIAVYKKVKKGEIKAIRVGKFYVIPKKYIPDTLGHPLDDDEKREIENAVKMTVRDYGDVLKKLGNE